MTKVKLQKVQCLGLSGDLLACEINDQMIPMLGTAQTVWQVIGDKLNDFRNGMSLPLQECSLQISPPFNLNRNYTAIAHIVIPTFANSACLTSDDRAKLKNCYDTLFIKARDMQAKTIVLPFLGIASAKVDITEAVNIAFQSAFDAIRNKEIEIVQEIFFFTTIPDVYEAAKSNNLYCSRKKMENQMRETDARPCSIGNSKYLSTRNSGCRGERISLLSVIDKWKRESRIGIYSDLLGCMHEADLIMCRIGSFDVDWNSDEASGYTICDRHLKIFLDEWRNPFFRNFKVRDGSTLCSFPEHQGPSSIVDNDRMSLVTKSDSKRWMAKRHTVLKVGIPMCEQDKLFLRGIEFDPVLSQQEFDLNETIDDVTNDLDKMPRLPKKTASTADPKVKRRVHDLLDELKCGDSKERRTDWVNLSERQKRTKTSNGRKLLDAVVQVLAPDAPHELKARIVNTGKVAQVDSCAPFRKYLSNAAELYNRCDNKMFRLFILASVASIELHVLKEFFVDLTPYYHKKARQVIARADVVIPRNLKSRFDEDKVDKLIEFVLSPLVVLNLPFDEREEKLDDGTVMSMPNLMRLQTIEEVYQMYLSWLEEEEIPEMALKMTSAKEIIKLVAPTRRKNLLCCDDKIADGMKAFDDLFASVTELLKKEFIDRETADGLNKALQRCKSYLRGDYKVHVRPRSDCADHCAQFALSDPTSPKLLIDCSTGPYAHTHDNQCQRCEEVNETLEQIKELLVIAANTAATEAECEEFSDLCDECDLAADAINAMKKHQLRSSLSHNEKAEYVESMVEGQALVVLDWAQKLTPFYAREKQVEYYAKAGLAYHISHAATIKDGEEAEHLSIHIFEPGLKQDGPAVYLIVESFLIELKTMGINRVMLRSDCAGCYRNAPLISAIFHLQRKIGVVIDGLLFSEAQSGKGPCDRGAARSKRKARDLVTTTRGKIETKEQFFNSLVTGKLLNGVSVHLCKIKNVKNPKSQLPSITSNTSFDFESDGIRMRRHRSIGEGLLHDVANVAPCDGQLETINSGGHTVAHEDLFWLTKTSHQSRATGSLMNVKPLSTSSRLIQCIEPNCTAEFISHHQQLMHGSHGKHTYEVERKTLHDYCTEMASRSIGTMMAADRGVIAATQSAHNGTTKLKMGWALRQVKRKNPSDKEARDLVRQFFAQQRNKGLKVNAHDAETFVRNARKEDGTKRVKPKNRLSIPQIKSIINGLLKAKAPSKNDEKSKKEKENVDSSDEEEEDEDDSDDEEYLRTLIRSHKDELFDREGEETEQDEPKRKYPRRNR